MPDESSNEFSNQTQPSASPHRPATTGDEMVVCALSGQPVRADEAHWAPPLITTTELIRTLVTTALQTPGLLGNILFGEQSDVPYHPDMRDELASRRTTEQLKLLLVLLLLIALIAIPVVWFL